MTTIHLPNAFDPQHQRGTMCGLTFDPTVYQTPLPEGDTVVTDWVIWFQAIRAADVTCDACTLMASTYEHMRSVPHPQPVTLRVHQLAKEAGRKAGFTLEVLKDLGYDARTHTHTIGLLGFEHEALIATLQGCS